MAYARRSTSRRRTVRRAPARRSYRRAPATRSRRVSGGRSGGTIRLVIEQASPSPVGRPAAVGIGLKEAGKPQKAKL